MAPEGPRKFEHRTSSTRTGGRHRRASSDCRHRLASLYRDRDLWGRHLALSQARVGLDPAPSKLVSRHGCRGGRPRRGAHHGEEFCREGVARRPQSRGDLHVEVKGTVLSILQFTHMKYRVATRLLMARAGGCTSYTSSNTAGRSHRVKGYTSIDLAERHIFSCRLVGHLVYGRWRKISIRRCRLSY
jgi:hypothetical protein